MDFNLINYNVLDEKFYIKNYPYFTKGINKKDLFIHC